MTEKEIIMAVEKMRDLRAWEKTGNKWRLKDGVWNHVNDPGVNEARLPLKGKTRYILNPKKIKPEPQEYTLM